MSPLIDNLDSESSLCRLALPRVSCLTVRFTSALRFQFLRQLFRCPMWYFEKSLNEIRIGHSDIHRPLAEGTKSSASNGRGLGLVVVVVVVVQFARIIRNARLPISDREFKTAKTKNPKVLRSWQSEAVAIVPTFLPFKPTFLIVASHLVKLIPDYLKPERTTCATFLGEPVSTPFSSAAKLGRHSLGKSV